MAPRYKPVVILLPVADFAALDASAQAHGHDTYIHAHWLLAQQLGLELPARLREDLARGKSEQGAEAER
jgi:predicted transposase YbfD/YdcC